MDSHTRSYEDPTCKLILSNETHESTVPRKTVFCNFFHGFSKRRRLAPYLVIGSFLCGDCLANECL